tara:strand:+ start:262 stop:879 length:618 start_codon:yes stop_codon:yes gene_type:complete
MSKSKVFCIGRNKTGTTTLEKSLQELGYNMGSQVQGEKLIREWSNNNFAPIIELAKSADAFQDVPFSYDFTYKYLDTSFPNSKFILSIRDTPEEWYNSLVRFHSKLISNKPLTYNNLLKVTGLVWEGWLVEAMISLYNTSKEDLYNKEVLINHYINYNKEIIEYFKDRPNDLLVINLKEEGSYLNFCKFLGKNPIRSNFPHLNKS